MQVVRNSSLRYDTPAYIFTLTDPSTGAVRYIGKTLDPTSYEINPNINDWVNSLHQQGLQPAFEVVYNVDYDWKADFWQRTHIEQHIRSNTITDLLNDMSAPEYDNFFSYRRGKMKICR